MRQIFMPCAAVSAAVLLASAADAQVAITGPVRTQTAVPAKLGVVVPHVEQAAEKVQIAPLVAPPALRNTLVVQSPNPLAVIQRLPVERELSFSEIRSTRALKLGSSTIDLSAMLEHRDALPNVAIRLQAAPSAVSVKAVDVTAFVVPQGLVVRSFLNYQIKPGTCSDSTRRRQIEAAGIACARRLSTAEKLGDYSDPSSPRFVAEPAKRAEVIAKAQADWLRQDAETNAQVANFRAILADPSERAKVASALGPDEIARLERLEDGALAGELISTAETKIEDVMFIPKADAVDGTTPGMVEDYRRRLGIPLNTPTVKNETIGKAIYLTGFTLGRQYEWSKRIEKTIKWCWVGCAVTYYAGGRAGFSYGFGLRFPIAVEGKYTYQSGMGADRGFVTATMTPIDGNPADYSAAGLDSSQVFKGQEFVAELKAFAGYDYSLPIIGSDSRTIEVGVDLAAMLPAPYTNGNFTPPMPGTTSGEIPFVFSSIDLLMGYGNWGAAGVLVHPAVKVGLHSDELRMTLHDNVAGTDQPLVSGAKLRVGVDPLRHRSSFWIGDPVYNLGFIVTPGVDAHAFIDIGVWSDSWHFPVWFPDIAITLPPGGIDFACHADTTCRRDYAFNAGSSVDPAADPNALSAERIDVARPGIVLDTPAIIDSSKASRSPMRALPMGSESLGRLSACSGGLVQRLATPSDKKCVPPAEAELIASENRNASANTDPNGAYGPATCVSGLVWRDAVPGDQVCVTPERRAAVAAM